MIKIVSSFFFIKFKWEIQVGLKIILLFWKLRLWPESQEYLAISYVLHNTYSCLNIIEDNVSR